MSMSNVNSFVIYLELGDKDGILIVNQCYLAKARDCIEKYFDEFTGADALMRDEYSNTTPNLETLKRWIIEDFEEDGYEVTVKFHLATNSSYSYITANEILSHWTDGSAVEAFICSRWYGLGIVINHPANTVLYPKPHYDRVYPYTNKDENERGTSMNHTAYSSAYTPINRVTMQVNRVWFNPPYTTVEWKDGTKTTACAENPEQFSEYMGFAACVTKRLYCSTTNANEAMTVGVSNAERPKREKAERRAAEKEQKRLMHEELMKYRESMLKQAVEKEKLARRAKNIVDEEEQRRSYE